MRIKILSLIIITSNIVKNNCMTLKKKKKERILSYYFNIDTIKRIYLTNVIVFNNVK